ncbi:MAG: hypothetical protein JXR91_02295 [Deltaproteobacteria bacterium]|nr:hypothetical protein [Deltaproteobacteria bacterium]
MNKFITVLSVAAVLGFIACESSVSKKMADSDTADTTDSSISETDSINDSSADTDSNTENNSSTDSSVADSDSENNSDTADTSDTSIGSDTNVGFLDQDSDGYSSILDCDDSNPDIYPGAPEPAEPNDSDEDCDGNDGYTIDTDTGGDPNTCQEAKDNRTYMGCDFWPTNTFNPVWYNFAASSGFEFAAVVSNGGAVDATVDVYKAGAKIKTVTVSANSLESIILPWVEELKGPTFSEAYGSGARVANSVRVNDGAYNIKSSVPVTVWQFNPLEYQISSWTGTCVDSSSVPGTCASVSNDASLLLPSTAMTGAYRVFGQNGENGGTTWGDAQGAIAITATEDDTLVKIKLSGDIVAATNTAMVAAAKAGDVIEFSMDAGDVVELLGAMGPFWGDPHSDLSGSVVLGLKESDPGTDTSPNYKPIQIIALNPILEFGASADHIEESVLPSQVIGTEYIVVPPTSSGGSATGHTVRFYGAVDGTILTYAPSAPAGAPTTLKAGDVVQVNVGTTSFKVTAQDETHQFAVASFMSTGEPSMTIEVAPEQFRNSYSFLAPTSYQSNYCDVLIPSGATVKLDGAAIGGSNTPIGTIGWSVQRVFLGSGPKGDGQHTLTSDMPVGLQVMGYGHATSYYYPGGLKLDIISDPPLILE